ncbi:MAG: branched-chain amino acid ABC transporter permease [Proteobacteria bacterium]|nr:branched-chain amino acid ABC transporter permease [Pseudomonadota bacterium]
MEAVTSQLANGVVVGTTIALTALGLTLIFGIMHIVNLAHGEFYALGAYFTWVAYSLLNNFWVSAAIGIVATAIIGAALLMMFYDKLTGAGPLRWALLTLGFGYVLRELMQLVFGTDFKLVAPPLEGTIPWAGGVYRIAVTVAGLLLILALALFLKKSRYGVLIRAIANNRDAAALVGVSTKTIYTWVALISAGLAGAAGAFMLPVTSAYPTMGLEIMIMAFVVVVVGGMGNIQGALIASLLAGLAQSLLTLIVEPTAATIIVLVAFMLVLVVRREGLQKLW